MHTTRTLLLLVLATALAACSPGGGDGDPGLAWTADPVERIKRALTWNSACRNKELWDMAEDTFPWMGTGRVETVVAIDALVACLAANDPRSCEAVFACLGVDTTKTCDPTAPSSCDGDTVVGCQALDNGSTGTTRRDCTTADAGKTACMPFGDGVTCARGPCSLADPFASACVGDIATYCVQGLEFGEDCPAQGEVCATDFDIGECEPPLASCFGHHCEGTTAVLCHSGREHRVDCALTFPGGGTCDVSLDPSLPCKPVEPAQCTGPNECNGDIAHVCLFGAWIDFDCAFVDGTCEETADDVRCRVQGWE